MTPFNSRSTAIFEPLSRNMIYLVFDTLTAILLARNQLASFCISELTLSISTARSWSESIPAVSSAKSRVRRVVHRCKSLIKHRKRIGPNILPCRTEMSISFSEDLNPPMSVYWYLSER